MVSRQNLFDRRRDRENQVRLRGRKKKRTSRHNFKSAASIILMSVSLEPPERLAEILREILALSDLTRTSQSESAHGSDPIELLDAHCVKEQSERRD